MGRDYKVSGSVFFLNMQMYRKMKTDFLAHLHLDQKVSHESGETASDSHKSLKRNLLNLFFSHKRMEHKKQLVSVS